MKPDLNFTALHIASHREANGASNGAEDPRLAAPLEAYLAALKMGDRPDREEFLAQYPGLAGKLAPLLDGLEFVHHVAPQLHLDDTNSSVVDRGKKTAPASLGDFCIVREVGRGGMGVVYEAEQISLARRVALKVLPFAAVMDPRRLARFRNEAQAAATLTHQHIVPVYAVGSAQGVHYYAMQFIDGCTLAEMIEQLRLAAGKTASNSPASHSPAVKQLAEGLTKGRAVRTPGESPQALSPGAPQRSAPLVDTVRSAQAAISTEHSHANAHYVRTVTELAVQIAEALDYAHRQGVVHRDIKPGNLLLDMQGNPWITDFGLARIETETNLTMTGDLVGTLRYMSPEQALAQRVIVDHRTDIYSFGVTLYELLTLEPLFAADGRQELLRDIAFREPTSLRKLQRSVPADLETIVMKSIAKNPAERYATAQEMADDLRRQLADQPIRARRPSILMRVRKWSRRHRAVVTAASAVSVCALLLGAGLLWRERSQTLVALRQAQTERVAAQREREVARDNFREAREAVDDYFTTISENRLTKISNMAPLRQELLETAAGYYRRFAEEHSDDPSLRAELAAAHIRLAKIYAERGSSKCIDELSVVIDLLKQLMRDGVDVSQWKGLRDGKLLVRYRFGHDDIRASAVNRLCNQAIPLWETLVADNPQVTGFGIDLASWYVMQGINLRQSVNSLDRIRTATFLNAANNTWRKLLANISDDDPARMAIAQAAYELGLMCHMSFPESTKYYQLAASAVEPLSKTNQEMRGDVDLQLKIYGHLGEVLHYGDRQQEAIAIWSKAIEFLPTTAGGFESRGKAYQGIGDNNRALPDFRRAVEMNPTDLNYWNSLAKNRTLGKRKGRQTRVSDFSLLGPLDFEVAPTVAECSRAIELEPDNADWFGMRATVNFSQGHYQDVLADVNELIKRADAGNNSCELHILRGRLERRMGMNLEAEADFKVACEQHSPSRVWLATARAELGRLDEALKDAPAGSNLRMTLLVASRQFDLALDELTMCVGQDPANPDMHSWRGIVLADLGRYDEAIAELSRTIELSPHRVEDYYRRGWIASMQGRYDGARADLEEAVLIDKFDPQSMRRLAWFLATCPDVQYCDAARAVTLAERAASIRPDEGIFWYTLGICLYRSGKYDRAIKACQRGIDQRDLPYSPIEEPRVLTDRDHFAGFFLAMSQWQLGDKKAARETFDAALAWTNENAPDDEQLKRFRAEAEALIALPDHPGN